MLTNYLDLNNMMLVQLQDRDRTRAAANDEAEVSAALSEKAMQQVIAMLGVDVGRVVQLLMMCIPSLPVICDWSSSIHQHILVQVFKLREDKRQEQMKASLDKRQTFQQKVSQNTICMQQHCTDSVMISTYYTGYCDAYVEAPCCCRKSENGILGKPRVPKTMWRRKRELREVLACTQALIPDICYGSNIQPLTLSRLCTGSCVCCIVCVCDRCCTFCVC